MTMSLRLSDETLVFDDINADGESALARVLDAKKLNPDGLHKFMMANTGSWQFAEGALAMLEMLEATLGRATMICHETDPKVIAERGAENSAPVVARSETGQSSSENSASSEPAP